MFPAADLVRSAESSDFGSVKRRSLLPARTAGEPRSTLPSCACTIPSPVDSTIKRSCGFLDDTCRSSGPKSVIPGGTSALETGVTVPETGCAAGAAVGDAGVVGSTVSDVVTTNCAAFALVLVLVSERMPLFEGQKHVSHGTPAVAVLPFTASATGVEPAWFQKKTGRVLRPAGICTLMFSVAAKQGWSPSPSPRVNATYRDARWSTENVFEPRLPVVMPVVMLCAVGTLKESRAVMPQPPTMFLTLQSWNASSSDVAFTPSAAVSAVSAEPPPVRCWSQTDAAKVGPKRWARYSQNVQCDWPVSS